MAYFYAQNHQRHVKDSRLHLLSPILQILQLFGFYFAKKSTQACDLNWEELLNLHDIKQLESLQC